MMKINISKIYFVFLVFVLCAFFNVNSNAQSACGINGSGAITDTGGPGGGACFLQPDQYYMTVYKVGLCTGTPTVSTSSAFNAANAANCTTIFENAGGSSVLVQKGISTPLSGTITKPANGAYTVGYIEVAPQFRVVASKTFSTNKAGSVGGGVGQYCWSKSGNAYVWNSSLPAFAECASSPGTAQITTQLMNSFPNPDPFTMTQALFSKSYSAGGTTVTAYLVKSDYMLPSTGGASAGGMNGVTRLIGVAPISASITPTTRGFNTSFDVTSGSTLMFSNTNAVLLFGGGPFSLIMTPTN